MADFGSFFDKAKNRKSKKAEDIRAGVRGVSKAEDAMRINRDNQDKNRNSDNSKMTYAERQAAREAKMSPEERAERERKIKAQSKYEDGGIAKKKKSYFSKIKDMCKK